MEKVCRAGQATDDNIAQRIASWIPKATNTHSQYVTLIAFPLQQRLQGRASMLRYTYIAYFVTSEVQCLNFEVRIQSLNISK